MKPYKLKHKPTGLYYQPHKHRGSNLSKRGKIYQTKTHGLSSAFKYSKLYPDKIRYQLFTVYSNKYCRIYKDFQSNFHWIETGYNEVKADTKLANWIIEEI